MVTVLNASFDGSDGSCRPVVDATVGDPLDDPGASADPAKWFARFAGVLYQGTLITNVAFDRFDLAMTAIDFDVGANVLSYTNAPSDIETVNGRQLNAVMDFPIP